MSRALSATLAFILALVTAPAHSEPDESARDKPAPDKPAPKTSAPDKPAPKTSAPDETDGGDTGNLTSRAPAEWDASGPYRLDLHLRFGGGFRLDAPPVYEPVRPGGILGGVGMNLWLSPRIAIGLAYEYLDAGEEKSSVLEAGVLDIERELHAGWLDLKLYPIKLGTTGIYASLGVALVVQGVDLSASVWRPEDPGNNLSFFCGGSDDPGFGFQGALGVDTVIGGALRMYLESGVANHRLSDDIVGGCAPGAGTSTILAMRGGLGYAWDL